MLDTGVEVFFVFAHNHHVNSRVFGADKRRISYVGPHVGKQAQHFAGGYAQASEPSALRGGDEGFQKNFCSAERFPGFGRDAGSVAAQIYFLADVNGLDGELRSARL